jgi:hypothetical protein
MASATARARGHRSTDHSERSATIGHMDRRRAYSARWYGHPALCRLASGFRRLAAARLASSPGIVHDRAQDRPRSRMKRNICSACREANERMSLVGKVTLALLRGELAGDASSRDAFEIGTRDGELSAPDRRVAR